MTAAVAVVGMACRYPEAATPAELWENVLAQRRAFRRIPSVRLRAEDYVSPDRSDPDRTYATQAAVLEGYHFDRVRYRVAGETYRSADLTHWLALDVAAEAFRDAGFPDGEGLPRETTGVLLGNSLTGEFSRANSLRYRWPYVRRVAEAVLGEEEGPPDRLFAILARLEAEFKTHFPVPGGESLAGGLSNTIAGRICNYFDLKGGGYTVDGACASSLLAVTNACSALSAGDLDLALAGGVDLSLDPFELVGFARVGALAAEEMRVYDARSAGFWPGEGCGLVVLMRHADAVAQHRSVYAVIRGWGISSDGAGGLTRPEFEGQRLAVRRAFDRAGFGADSVGYFEGHGTGTEVGDAVELRVLSDARRVGATPQPPAALGSIKANIGHTKAAAGAAGLIKAVMALHSRTLPPTTGCSQPHPELCSEKPALRVLRSPEPWPQAVPLRAGVSAMGFGGINTHVVVEGVATQPRLALDEHTRLLGRSPQDAELFLLGGESADDLLRQLERLAAIADGLSRSELGDLAAHLSRTLGVSERRAALVAATPEELATGLRALHLSLTAGVVESLDVRTRRFLGAGARPARIGFLFPGQGSPAHLDGGIFRRRFAALEELYAAAGLPAEGDGVPTQVAQPAIVTASLAALRLLRDLELDASVAIGHSLGELTALHWAGAMDAEALQRIAASRGRAMGDLDGPTGAMLSVSAGRDEISALLHGLPAVIAGVNSPRRTVVSGPSGAVAAVAMRATAAGIPSQRLSVSHAFHSPLVAGAAQRLAEGLLLEALESPRRPVASTITGRILAGDEDLRFLLELQITAPVLFVDAVRAVEGGVDLWLEVGPGHALSTLMADFEGAPAISIDAGGPSLAGLLSAAAAAYALGAPLRREALFGDRFVRPFDPDLQRRFLTNPCELAPVSKAEQAGSAHTTASPVTPLADAPPPDARAEDTRAPELAAAPGPRAALEVVRGLVAEKAELPVSAIRDEYHLLGDLHLNSITVGEIVASAGRAMGLAPPSAPLDYAAATVGELARALEEVALTAPRGDVSEGQPGLPAGVDSWVRAFTLKWEERPRGPRVAGLEVGSWRVIAPEDEPLAEPLRRALAERGPGSGVLVCLPSVSDPSCLRLLLEGVKAALGAIAPSRFVLLQRHGGGAACARTLVQEDPGIIACVINLPADAPPHDAVSWILAESEAARGFVEVAYDADGRRREPVLRLLPDADVELDPVLGPDDVVLVTGGAKGITAECALSVAVESGSSLAIVGRSSPDRDPELAEQLERIGAAGVRCRYIVTDLTDAESVREAVRQIEASLGPVTAVLHGAALNQPRLLRDLENADFSATLAPKLDGARNLLAALGPRRLRLFVSFGSIIARTGLPGAAHYALANEWLALQTQKWRVEYPTCRWLTLEWSLWSGVGMGMRLGRVDALARTGVTPISPDQGIAAFRQLISRPLPAVPVVVTGRFGSPATLRMDESDLPLLRFLEHPLVHYPGVELVVEADLSLATDPYLADHVVDGEYLLPAVVGLEAMAQAAAALVGEAAPPEFRGVCFHRAVVVPEHGSLRVRIAALARAPGSVKVVIRSEGTAFQVDHFSAECVFPAAGGERFAEGAPPALHPHEDARVDPARDLYGSILFHAGRFRRLTGYRVLRARECVALVSPDGNARWYGEYLPPSLFLGDPAARDAAIHAIQACIPHARVLPVRVRRVVAGQLSPGGAYIVCAHEVAQEGPELEYDVEILASDGSPRERWEGLRLRRVSLLPPRPEWTPQLLSVYLERRLGEILPTSAVTVALTAGQAGRRAATDGAIRLAVGAPIQVRRRPDGKPEVRQARLSVSASHAANLTLAVAAPGVVGCDLEPVVARSPSSWRDLLQTGIELATLIALEAHEDEATAATRVWAARECLRKAGSPADAPLLLASVEADGWVLLDSGECRLATTSVRVRGRAEPFAVAVLVAGEG